MDFIEYFLDLWIDFVDQFAKMMPFDEHLFAPFLIIVGTLISSLAELPFIKILMSKQLFLIIEAIGLFIAFSGVLSWSQVTCHHHLPKKDKK